jgi:hypothetical protein
MDPDRMIKGNYYVFKGYDIDNIPIKVFGKFNRKKFDGGYEFTKVIVNSNADVARTHRVSQTARHPNYSVNGSVVFYHINHIELVPVEATKVLYALLKAAPTVDANTIADIVDRLKAEPAGSPNYEDYGMRAPTITKNSFGGKSKKSKISIKKTKKQKGKV